MRALITGICGFAGSHLTEHLLSLQDVDVVGIGLPTDRTDNLSAVLPRITLRRLDLGDYDAVEAALRELRPDLVFHLAAQASVGRAWGDPASTLVNNMTAQLSVLRAVATLGLSSRVLVVGSADEYGHVRPEDLPVDEDTPLRPVNPYAVSKITQDYLGLQYHLSHDLFVVRVRPFNHIGPRQGPGFVVPDFCQQVALVEAGRQEPVMRVGNLSARRDFTDVRDMVRGYHLALTQGQPGQVYNIGSGTSHPVREVLDTLLDRCRVPVRVENDPARMRPSDIPEIVCDATRFQRDTQWCTQYRFEQSLADALDDWRGRV